MKLNIYKECLHYYCKIRRNKSWFNGLPIFFRQKVLKKFEIPYIEIFITTKCNLNCKFCSNMIPYIETQITLSFDEFKHDIDMLLSKVDSIYRLKLHGGEVFLHPELDKFITYLEGVKKIKSIRLATNGTVVPTEKILNTLSVSKTVVQISDYPEFSEKAVKLADTFQKYGVKHVKLKGQKWRNMGEIKKRQTNQFEACSIKRCTSLYKGKIYVCSRAAMMEAWGCHFYDGIDIASDKRIFRKELLNMYNGLHCKACWYCDGDTEFAEEIPAGEQML